MTKHQNIESASLQHAILGREWVEYYNVFDYFSTEAIREGCHPFVMVHDGPVKKAVVLVHGLTDSPHFMKGIAHHMHTRHRYNVFVPLLQCHGLRDPKGMTGVRLEEWKKNVRYAIKVASSTASEVSIGGLSMGGALSFFMAASDIRIEGSVFLFSAAIDLAGGFSNMWGQVKERILRSRVPDMLDFGDSRPLIGDHPYRYARMDKGAAKQLGYLLKENDRIIESYSLSKPFPRPVFAAHSERDTTASITGINRLKNICDPERVTFYLIPKERSVPHASVVLSEAIYRKGALASEAPLEKANPCFGEMMEELDSFIETQD